MLLEEKILNGNCLYTPGGAAREYAAVGCNFYRGCPYQCKYCYNRKGWTAKVMGVDYAVLKNNFTNTKYRPKKYAGLSGEEYAYKLFVSEVEKNLEYLRQTGIFYSFSTDPMCPDAYELTVKTAMYAVRKGVPVRILTKNADQTVWNSILDVFSNLTGNEKKRISLGFTLTGCDDWEPHASPNSLRIERMKLLHNKGFNTFASIEPVIDFQKSFQMIINSISFCDFYMIGLLSHFADYYNDGSRRSFEGTTFFKKIFLLQQILGLKIYYKESVKNHFDSLLYNLYNTDTQRFPYQVKPVVNVYEPFTVHSYVHQCYNAVRHINKNVALLYLYEYIKPENEQFDILCLRLFFKYCLNEGLLKDNIKEGKEDLSILLPEFVTLKSNLTTLQGAKIPFFNQSFINDDLEKLIATCDKVVTLLQNK